MMLHKPQTAAATTGTRQKKGERGAMTEETYSDRWSDLAGQPTGVIGKAQARERHATGEPYTVTLGAPYAPDAVIDVAWKNDYLGVWFFDEQVRRSVHFAFRAHGDKLFLTTLTNWKYPEGAVLRNEATSIERVAYTVEGIVTREVTDQAALRTTTQDLSDVDVTMNWECAPAFGEWESVARFERC